ncbi:Pam17-domain-containing protein [Westerdykella ornata]|uniref:Presequence translocated-associated motor subunit PAM17 n=1 Tax=Westerdykella ornata TaxID=318751 RepID=A0A6A6JY33_WESOR|nr:Pam17-domain-containing protein [Westerdykella ornata]KAF2280748.1 Pam17-domain-containing protein [Westerdykella ornata]
MLLAPSLRPTGAFPVRLIPCTASFTTSARPTKIQRTQQPLFASAAFPVVRFARFASTANATSPSPNAPSPSATSSSLTWNRFLTLRRTRRKISVVASSISSVATAYVGLRSFLQAGYDTALSTSLGLDPILTTGLSTIAFLAVGWLIGPFFGNAAFNMRYSSIRKEFQDAKREFYNRIKRHRVDPTSSSMANPVPDYYGEKIGSVADYRRWLKDQRAFNLKRGAYLGTK